MTQKAILTFTDREDGEVGVKLEFIPPVKVAENATNAMVLAMRALRAAQDTGEDDE